MRVPKLKPGEAFVEMLRQDTPDERLVTSRAVKARLETVTIWRDGPEGKPELDRQARLCFPEGAPEELRNLISAHVYTLLSHLAPRLCGEEGCRELSQDDLMDLPAIKMIVGVFGPVSFVQFSSGEAQAISEDLSEDELRRGLDGVDLSHPPFDIGKET